VVEQGVYLLTIYDKSEKESISDEELDEMLKIAGLLYNHKARNQTGLFYLG